MVPERWTTGFAYYLEVERRLSPHTQRVYVRDVQAWLQGLERSDVGGSEKRGRIGALDHGAQIVRGQGTPQKRIDTGAKVVTPDNMNSMEMEKILYPLGKKE